MNYELGEFICPGCKNRGMSIYTEWLLNKEYFDKYGLKAWIFYKKNKEVCFGWFCFCFPLSIACLCDYCNSFVKCFCYLISFLLNIAFAVVYLPIYLLIVIWIDIFFCKRRKITYTCLYFNYKKYLFEKKVFTQKQSVKITLKDFFGTKEQDLIQYGKKFFICNKCKRKEDSFYNFIPKSVRDSLGKKYFSNANDTNEINSMQTEIKVLVNSSNHSNNMSILFITPNQSFLYLLSYSINDTFASIENKLYQNSPQFKNENYFFLCNGIKITEKTKNLWELKIKNTDIIVICKNENPPNIINEDSEPIISIVFSKNQEYKSLPCNINDTFESIENKLYQYFPQLKNENNYFLFSGNIIAEKTKTLRELSIDNSANIMICENQINSIVKDKKIDLIISIMFFKEDNDLSYSLACNVNQTFSDIEKKFYYENSEFKNKGIYFKHNDIKITEKTKTLAELNFQNSDIVYICENEQKKSLNKLFTFINKN